jgi:Antitoxin VbhA
MNIAGFPSPDEAQERLPREIPALDVDRAARANSIKNAIAITAMEGGRPSAFCLELLSLYEAGEISGADMHKRMLEKARS